MPSMTPRFPSYTASAANGPRPAAPRATGSLRAASTRHKEPKEHDEIAHTSYMGERGQKDAGDGAGARLVKVPDESDAGFVPPKRSLGLHDHTVSAEIQRK